MGGYWLIPSIAVRDVLPESVPMGDFRGCQRHSQVFEGVREGLREREPHGRVCQDKFSVLKEVGAAIGDTV